MLMTESGLVIDDSVQSLYVTPHYNIDLGSAMDQW